MTSQTPEDKRSADSESADRDQPTSDDMPAGDDPFTQAEIDLPEPELFTTHNEKLNKTKAPREQTQDPGQTLIDSEEVFPPKAESNGRINPEEQTVHLEPEQERTLSSSPTLLPEEGSSRPKMGTFGEYELLDILGRGGMGLVYKARQPRLDRLVALKMVIKGQFDSEAEVQRFKTEAEAVAKLDHPGIVPVYDVGEIDGRQYFSMGYVEGNSLATMIAQSPLPPRQAAKILAKVADAIGHAHQRGILHRDLKPSNVLVDKAKQPKVIDFGLAKRFEEDANLTATGMVVGTPSYMAPERIDERIGEVGPRSDIYSLGAMLYEMVSGKPPFHASSPVDTMEQVLRSPPVPLSKINSQVPEELDAICLHCLQKDPQKRYATAEELAQDLRRWLDHEPVIAPQISTASAKQRSLLTAFVTLLAVAAIACSGFLGWQLQQKEQQIRILESKVDEANTEVASAKSELDAAKNNDGELTLKTSLEQAEQEVQNARKVAADAKTQAESLKQYLTMAASDNEKLNSQIEALSTEKEALQSEKMSLIAAQSDVQNIRDLASQMEYWATIEGGAEADRLTTQGLLEYKSGQPQQAIELFNAAIDKCQQYLAAYYYRAYARINSTIPAKADLESAIADLKVVLEQRPDNVPSRTLRGKAYLELKEFDLAKADITHARKFAPDNPQLLFMQAICLSQTGFTTEAERDFEHALELDPNFAQAHFEYAKHQLAQPGRTDFADALEHAKKACEITKRKNADYLVLLAVAYSKTKQFDEAVEQIDAAIDLFENDVDKRRYEEYRVKLKNRISIDYLSNR